MRCYIALGSNLNNPAGQLRSAIRALNECEGITVIAVSRWYQNPAIGPGEQPDFLNGVIAIDTALSPAALLACCQGIENRQGRQRSVRWGPRTLDLDILLYGDEQINSPYLEIPHPRLWQRNFVLYPLADLAPTLVLPGGVSLQTLLANCPADGLITVEESM